jgi:hypothetical protein
MHTLCAFVNAIMSLYAVAWDPKESLWYLFSCFPTLTIIFPEDLPKHYKLEKVWLIGSGSFLEALLL